MRALIASAQTELVVMVHAISDPAAADLIAERAKAGVAVTIVRNDPKAQAGVRASRMAEEQALLDRLEAAGARVVIVPIDQLARRTALNTPHDHRKLIIADRSRAYVGGANPRTHLDNFDTGVLLEGPVVKALARQAAIDIAHYAGTAGGHLPRVVDNPDKDAVHVLSTGGTGTVFVVAVHVDHAFELPQGRAAIEARAKTQPSPPSNPLQLLPHYCRAHGFDCTTVKDVEGPGRDYVIVYDEHRLRPVVRPKTAAAPSCSRSTRLRGVASSGRYSLACSTFTSKRGRRTTSLPSISTRYW